MDRVSWVSIGILAAVLLVGLVRLAGAHSPPRDTVSIIGEVRGH